MPAQKTRGERAALRDFKAKIVSEGAIWREAEWGDMRVG